MVLILFTVYSGPGFSQEKTFFRKNGAVQEKPQGTRMVTSRFVEPRQY
jgi:hypothetical protein